MPNEGIEDFRIVIVICCVWEKETPSDQHNSNTQTSWQLSAGDEKSIPVLTFNGWLNSILGFLLNSGNRFALHNPFKNIGSVMLFNWAMLCLDLANIIVVFSYWI
jgi:hypothetical protein